MGEETLVVGRYNMVIGPDGVAMQTTTITLPICCDPEAFKLLASQLSAIESTDALLYGAIALSMHQLSGIVPSRIDTRLQRMADTIRSRVRGHQPQAILAHMHEVLFEEERFIGNTNDYYNTANSYLPQLLETKRGLPISLSLIYKIIGERLGLRTCGIALPGHFLAGVQFEGSLMLIDPFYGGRELSPEEAHARMQQVYGPEVEWSDDLLQPTTNRQWLTRMLQNLLNTFASAGQYNDVAAMLEMEMLLWPNEDRLQRDLALVLARCGMSQPAFVWLDQYLKNNPDDPQKRDLKQLLDVLAA